MAKNQDALFRQWHMLRLMTRYPQKISVQDVQKHLAGEGFEITERSIQRDLNELSASFPLCCDTREKPYGWSWQKDAASFDLPGLTIPAALSLAMVEQHLKDLFPAPMLEEMQPYFQAAHARLDAEPKPHRGRSWLNKVRSVPPTQALLPPKIDHDVQRRISEALLHERQAAIHYRKRGERTPVEYRIHPLALIQRGPMIYLYCRIFDYEDARSLALNRITSVRLLEQRTEYPKDFSIDTQVELGTWGFGPGTTIKLELVFQPGYGDHLYETPLSQDQAIAELADGQLQVKATVADTPQLTWWLLGFGEGVEVLKPEGLRREMARTAMESALVYQRKK